MTENTNAHAFESTKLSMDKFLYEAEDLSIPCETVEEIFENRTIDTENLAEVVMCENANSNEANDREHTNPSSNVQGELYCRQQTGYNVQLRL